jgi:hypothetical protein
MTGTHPKSRRATMVVGLLALVAIASVGCQTHPTAMTNPFAQPDRVPPPSTRTLLPGQAAPYYQGDPIPTLQSSQPQPAAVGVLAQKSDAAPPSSDAREIFLATADEPSIRINSDDEPLRPDPPRQELAVAALNASGQQAISLVSYNQSPASPVDQGPTANEEVDSSLGSLSAPATQSMWRSPGVARANGPTPLTNPQPPYWPNYSPGPVAPALFPGVVQAQPTPAGSTMGVRLRSVTSPQTPSGETSSPRIRLPGYAPPIPTQAGIGPQTLAITPVHEVAYQEAVAPTGTVVSADGFRARGSTR